MKRVRKHDLAGLQQIQFSQICSVDESDVIAIATSPRGVRIGELLHYYITPLYRTRWMST